MIKESRKVLVLAGGVPQIELIKQLRARGFYTILADGNKNAVAAPFADSFFCVQIFDIEAVKELAQTENVSFIMTVCADQVLLVAAQVSEMLGLPFYIDYKTALDVSDKERMKRVFWENDIPTSKYFKVEKPDDPALSQLKYPLIVKPVDAYSSRGVRKALNGSDLKQFFAEAKQISRTGGVIVEEYCPGEEISVDAFIINGKAHVLCVTNSDKILDDGRFVIFRGRHPADISEETRESIQKVAQQITDAFGLANAPLLIQMINNNGHVSVLEFCARTGGNMKWLLIKYSSGVDVISATIDLFIGNSPDITPVVPTHKIVVNDFIYGKPGTFDHVEGFSEFLSNGMLNEYYVIRPKGFCVAGVRSSSDRLVGINIVADSIDEFNYKQKRVTENVKILDETGNDIMRHDLFSDLPQ